MDISGSEDEHEETTSLPGILPIVDPSPDVSPGPPVTRSSTVTQLVSYGAHEEEDEDDDENETTVRLNVSEHSSEGSKSPINFNKEDAELPPEPTAKCSRALQDKVAKQYEKFRRQGTDLNKSIQLRKEFRNPSIYEKLVDFCSINEKGTNYPLELYNPGIWGEDSFYEALAKVQKEDIEKKEKDKKERTKVEFVTATKKSDNTVKQERKTKWDSQNQPVLPTVKKSKS